MGDDGGRQTDGFGSLKDGDGTPALDVVKVVAVDQPCAAFHHPSARIVDHQGNLSARLGEGEDLTLFPPVPRGEKREDEGREKRKGETDLKRARFSRLLRKKGS